MATTTELLENARDIKRQLREEANLFITDQIITLTELALLGRRV